jgi:hypothetical protein
MNPSARHRKVFRGTKGVNAVQGIGWQFPLAQQIVFNPNG